MQRLREVARKMRVGGGDRHAFGLVDDRDNALQRMLRLLLRLVVAQQMQYLLAVPAEEFAAQPDEAGGEFVVHALASRTAFAMRLRRSAGPGPTPVLEYGAAIRTHGRLAQLAPGLVAVVHQFLQQPVAADRLVESAFAFHD